MSFKPLIAPINAGVWHRAAQPYAKYRKEPDANPIVGFDNKDRAVEIRFAITPPDVEKKEIILSIGREDFHLLFDAMMKASG